MTSFREALWRGAWTRRDVLALGAAAAGCMAVGMGCRSGTRRHETAAGEAESGTGRFMWFEISLAQWSLHRALQSGRMTSLDFAQRAAEEFGVFGIEYVNSFLKDRARDTEYLNELNRRARRHGVRQLLIMCDGEGALGDPDESARARAVENHVKWLEAAAHLGCHSIRVNAASEGSFEEQQRLAADGLRKLAERAEPFKLHVIVENHGGWSSHGGWLAGVMRLARHERLGTLPDFGNFNISASEAYDRYKGVEELMAFAKAVSAKSHDFDDAGNERFTDYGRMMKIVALAGYNGYVGIEYEGERLSEPDGIRATKRLLERVREELAETGRIARRGTHTQTHHEIRT